MTSTLPYLAPSAPSRIVTINEIALGEAAPPAGSIEFRLRQPLRLASTGQVLRPSAITVGLTDGKGQVRLPHVSSNLLDDCGDTWTIGVKPSWLSHPYSIRVPQGSTPIPLGNIAPANPLPYRATPWAITSVSVGVESGTTGGSGSVQNGVLRLDLQIPSDAYYRGTLADGVSPNSLTYTSDAGIWGVSNSRINPDMPFTGGGALLTIPSGFGLISQTAWEYGDSGSWTRERLDAYSVPEKWSEWDRVVTHRDLAELRNELADLRGQLDT